ncbi:reverse transcriptase [Ancylostoma duodenale]|uniref:RNA-directed DNA polymerase n=1 Tax=Ancylostoma duodenale TaxID=51022 RepID=A0A0C2FKB8_9BILA|nr:reverse transcriptase [Ancylostoma duodenale]
MIDNKDGGTTAVPSAATIQPDSGAQEVYRGRAPGPFVPGISWRTWWKLFTNFLTLRKVVDEKERCLVFLQEGQELGATDLADLFNAMEKHFQPKKLILAERFGLMSKSQKPGQSLHEFYAELQKAANGCQFEQIKNHRDAIVTMVLIGGLQSLETRKRLLEKEDLTSKEALEHLEALKRVGINAPHLKEGPRPLGVAEFVTGRDTSPMRTGEQQRVERKTPAKCIGVWSLPEAPTATRRRKSEKTGEQKARLESLGEASCKPKWIIPLRQLDQRETCRQSLQSELHVVHVEQNEKYSEVLGVAKEPPRMLEIVIEGHAVPFELDTGASMLIIDEKTWKKIGAPELKESKVEATAYNNERIQLQGKVTVSLNFVGHSAIMDVHVFKQASRSLCGRDMIKALCIDCGPHYNLVYTVKEMSKVQVKREIVRILHENKQLFEEGLGKCTSTKAKLKFKADPVPKFFRARPVPIALRPKVEAKLEELLRNGTLRRVEHSQWATPLVIVPKPGGKIRICGDYEATANPQLDINQYPLPRPEDLFHMLNGGKKFSKLDLSDAYMQVELDPESRKYTTINTQKGLFEYTRVPFGIASAPAMFQRTMETTLSGIEGVLIYLDDITVTGPDDKTHMERLEKVLRRLKEVGFRLKREKCEFFKQEMEFLGHVVDANGIRPSPSKLKAILNMPEPKNIKELESYLGMVQYYGKFIPRRGVELGKEQVEAFKAIQGKLASTDTLAHYNPDVPVVLATNASEYGLGAVIYHKYSDNTEKVIAYASRSLTKEERNYAQIEKEALGIVYGVEKFNQFLYGRQFTLLTDHQPLVRIFGRKLGLPVIAAKRLHRWALRLMVYSFNIEYRRTEDFGNADGLSRLPDPRELPSAERVINEVQMQQMAEETFDRLPMTVEEIAEATTEDEILQKVIAFMQRGWPEKAKVERLRPFAAKKSSLSLYKGCLMWDSRVVIPQKYRTSVLKMLHNSHYGRNRMLSLARTIIWFPGMDDAIERIAKGCSICAALGKTPARIPLHPWEEPEKVWVTVTHRFLRNCKWSKMADSGRCQV